MINYFNNRDYELGFDAHALGEPLDKGQSEAWQNGLAWLGGYYGQKRIGTTLFLNT